MKKSMFTLLGVMVFMLLTTPQLLLAQDNSTNQQEEVIVIRKIKDADGNVQVQQQRLKKGEKLEAYVNELNLDNVEGDNIELNFFTDSDQQGVLQIDKKDAEGETIFFFRNAELSRDLEDLEDEMQSLRITLNDQEQNWTFKSPENHVRRHHIRRHFSEKAFLGIYPSRTDEGILITKVVAGSGAEKAGLQKDDIITAINGQNINANGGLTSTLAEFKPGDVITIDYLRAGSTAQTTATLTGKKTRHYYRHHAHRDPCKVFIGVYTSSRDDRGLYVSGIVSDTPAEKAYMQKGDIITAIDGVQVNTHRELVTERDKHEPGDYFTLNVIRNGANIEVDAQFKSCPKPEEAVEERVEEEPEVQEEIEEENLPPANMTLNTLELEEFKAFPNPTYGPVTVQFKGAAQPTTVSITDASGKQVFNEVLNSFNGTYNKDLNLDRATPGTLVVTIRQDGKVFTQSLILMPRA